MIRNRGNHAIRFQIVFGAVTMAYCSLASLADSYITGVVRNRTQNRLAAGDEVILLRLNRGAQEETRTITDAQGSFTLQLQESDKPHLLRVIHQGVNYDREVLANKPVSIDVFDATSRVRGITGGTEMIRAGNLGSQLHVSDMVQIENNSNPPMTQAGERTFEVYLPADAKINSVLAAGPENIGSMISASPVHGESGHYTVNYSLQPGATKFAFNYDLPYNGHAVFYIKSVFPLRQLEVMIPATMTFTSRSTTFQILPVGNSGFRVEAAQNVKAGGRLEFEIAGTGGLPSMQAQAHSAPIAPSSRFATSGTPIPGRPTMPTHGTNALAVAPVSAFSSRPSWWVLVACMVLMAGASGFLIRHSRRAPAHAIGTTLGTDGQTTGSLVDTLKDGLFQLEVDRMQGNVRGEEYASVKRALETSIVWALARTKARETRRRVETALTISGGRL